MIEVVSLVRLHLLCDDHNVQLSLYVETMAIVRSDDLDYIICSQLDSCYC